MPGIVRESKLIVTGDGSGGGAITLTDGVDPLIVATVFDRPNSNPLAIQLVDSNGDPIAVSNLGTQYTEGSSTVGTDQLTMAGVIRSDVRGPLDTNGKRTLLQVNGSGDLRVDNSAVTQPISALVLPLPTGASTAALQTQPGVDIGDVTVNNGAAAAAVNIQDGGNSITVDAAVLPLPTGASTEATQLLQSTAGKQDIGNASLSSIDSKVDVNLSTRASQVTVASIDTKVDVTLSTRLAEATFTNRINTLGQKTSANSTPVVIASDQTTFPVTANAGVNLNTSLLALEATTAKDSSLTTIDTDIKASQPRKLRDANDLAITLGQKLSASSLPVVIASDQSTIPVDTELPIAASLADGSPANPVTPTVGTISLLMNAATVDRQRAVTAGMDSIGTGIQASGLVGQLDDTNTTLVTEDQFSTVRITNKRLLKTEVTSSDDNKILDRSIRNDQDLNYIYQVDKLLSSLVSRRNEKVNFSDRRGRIDRGSMR